MSQIERPKDSGDKKTREYWNNPVVRLGTGLVLLAGAGAIGYEIASSSDSGTSYNPSTLRTRETPTPSYAGLVATPNPSEAAGTPNPEYSGGVTSPETAALAFGRDEWSKNPDNWTKTDNEGWVLKPNPNGLTSVVEVRGVGQGYLDAKVREKNQAIALVILDGETFPVRGITVYPNDADANRAFSGAVELEQRTQPGVYLAEVCDTIQAVSENRQDLSNPAQWEAEKITPEEAASRYGRDEWSKNPDNWDMVDNGYGARLKPALKGLNSVINTEGAVAQAYWDAKVDGQFQAIAITLGVGTEIAVRGATVYGGVPEGMENAAVEFALKQAVNLEIETQPGVFVGQVCRTAQAGATAPDASQPATTATPETTTTPRPSKGLSLHQNQLQQRIGAPNSQKQNILEVGLRNLEMVD